jgi:hypothetical protein
MTQQFNLDKALELVKQGARIDGKKEIMGLYLQRSSQDGTRQP